MDALSIAMSGLESFGYFAIFLLIVIGSFGIPLPEESILLLAGYLASVGLLKLPVAIIVACISAIIGDNLGYWLARKKGLQFMLHYGDSLFSINRHHLKKAESFFTRHGGKAVFLSRFILGFRFFGPVLAGVSKMKWKKFQVYNLIGIAIWIPLVTFLGYFFGGQINSILVNIKELSHIIAVIVLLIISWFLIKKLIKD